MAASALKPEPPSIGKLNDISVQKSELGVNIPRIFGSYRTVCNVFWAHDLEQRRDGGGKGQGDQIRYEGGFMAIASQCLDKANGAEAIGNVYFNNKLVADFRNPGNLGTVTPQLGGAYYSNNDGRYAKRAEYRLGLRTQQRALLPNISGYESTNNYSSHPGLVYIAFDDINVTRFFGNQLPAVEAVVWDTIAPPSLASVVTQVLQIAGIPLSRIDVSGLPAVEVLGDKLDFDGSGVKAFLENLALVYDFTIFETSTGVIKAKANDDSNNSTAYDLDEGLLYTREYGSAQISGIESQTTPETELPSSIELSYRQINNGYRTGTQKFVRPEAKSINDIKINCTTVLTDDQAIKLVKRLMSSYIRQRTTYSNICLPLTFDFIELADKIKFDLNSQIVIAKVIRKEVGANGMIKLTAVGLGDSSYTPGETNTDDDYSPGTGNILDPILTPIVLETPILTVDSSLDFDSLRLRWLSTTNPLETYVSADILANNAGTLTNLGSEPTRVAYGVTVSALPMASTSTIQGQSLTVQLTQGTVENSSYQGLISGTHCLMIGDEIISYRDVNSPSGVVIFSTFIRGFAGTEFAATSYPVGTPVYVVKSPSNAASTIELPTNTLNTSIDFISIVTGANTSASSPVVTDLVTGVALRPYAPADIKLTALANGDLQISWKRRTRYNGEIWNNSGTVPLNEASESYLVNVTGLITNATSSAPNIIITAATLASAGTTNTATRTVTVAQVSALYGAGTPATYTGTPHMSQ